ncbi:MAG: M15 family metallopeptidase [Anaerolineae bacterium]|nr:M15 family metallopeptidase [Anaerolineae bacterium]
MPKRLRRRAIARRHDADQEPSLSVIREDDYEPTPDPANTNTLTPPNVLRLQNTHGNQAVQRMIATQKNSAPSNVVQRGVFDWMMETAESIARPYINYGKMIWEQAQAQKAAQAASGQTPAPATTPQTPDPATEALEEAADQEVKLAKAKLLTDDQAQIERQRALDQARFTEKEQKEIDAIGVEKLAGELTTKHAELKKLQDALRVSRDSLRKLTKKLKTAKSDKVATLQKQIDDLNKAITDDVADEKTLKERVAFLKSIVRKHGYEGVMDQMETALGGKDEMVKWFNEFDPNATFLGVKIIESDKSEVAGVHKKMSEALQKAETHLMSLPQYAGKEPIEVAEALGIRRISGLRQPKKSASSDNISPHCYGLAIDINAMANPYVGLNTYKVGKETRSFTAEVVIRAAQALGRSEKNIRTLLPGNDVGEMWDFLEEASDSMRDYFALRNDETALQDAAKRLSTPDKPVTAADLKKQIEEDYKWLYDKSDFKAPTEAGAKERDPAKGFMDLPKELVVALVEAGGLTWGGMFQTAKDIQHFQLNGVLGNDED